MRYVYYRDYHWVVKDNDTNSIVHRFISELVDPKSEYGCPWGYNSSKFTFIKLDIVDTLERLELKKKGPDF